MTPPSEEFDGLKWVVSRWALRPRWTANLNIEHIREVVRKLLPSAQNLTITFLAEGAFNRVYNIRTQDEELIMPVDPQRKTLSEVATLEWVRCNTHIPAPKVFAHDASRNNPIGVEWMLMSKRPGRPLLDVWESMDFAAKKQVTHEVAIFFSALFEKQLRGIGNLYSGPKRKAVNDSALPEVGRIVSTHFFWGHRITHLVPRGPFRSSRDWLEASLLCSERDCKSTIARCNEELSKLESKYEVEDEDKDGGNTDEENSDKEDIADDITRANGALEIISRLRLLLDDLFPSRKHERTEPSVLFHDDVALRNILVDDAGVLTGVLDWECASALPLWKACDYPEFLRGPERHVEPDRALYRTKFIDIFNSDMADYENTRLRKYFLEEMQKVAPGWVKVFEASEQLRDFDEAARHCTDVSMAPKYIRAWLDDIALGKENMERLWERSPFEVAVFHPNAVEVC